MSTTYQKVSGPSVLTLPKSGELSPQMGMRTRLEGTQARGAGELHTQKANVAEVSYGKDSECRTRGSSLIMHPPGGERVGVTPI